ncbi:MarR family winged helix-turn-helix transcriptional regulator [Aquabacterium sp.]|uniref:MarR family winged helix-turn-helix transcriptional regulator n=1 Tax=Aquabacterium sp. TaxID=1872578 RepID=UPI003D6D47D6
MFDHCLYFNTTALARQLEREWALAFKPFELTPPQAFMLRAVIEQPGMLQHQLASLLDIARPTATRALDGLEAKRLIERRSVEADGREQAIHPTPKAVAMKKDLNQASGAVTARLKKLLGSDSFAATVESVKGVRSALK